MDAVVFLGYVFMGLYVGLFLLFFIFVLFWR